MHIVWNKDCIDVIVWNKDCIAVMLVSDRPERGVWDSKLGPFQSKLPTPLPALTDMRHRTEPLFCDEFQ